ncbi:MAG: GAF domain-containing sensor histidine kinase [Chloroflexota bacterium]
MNASSAALTSGTARHLGRIRGVIAAAQDLVDVLRQSAATVAEATRADAVSIRIGPSGGAAVVHVRRGRGVDPATMLTRLDVPLTIRGRRVGMVTAHRASRRAFPPQTSALMGAFGGPIAMAIDNSRLYDALQDRLADLSRLAGASEAVAALGDVEGVGARITRHAAHVVGAERAALLTQDLVTRAYAARVPAFGIPKVEIKAIEASCDEQDPSLSAVLSGERAFIANDVRSDRRAVAVAARDLGERSVLVVGLPAASGSRALLRVSNKVDGLFTQQDARLLGVFAAQAATALQNASLYGRVVDEREQLRELEALKSQFLSLVSHELRTPLSSIKASAEVLLATAAPSIQPARLRLLQNIDRSSDRLNSLITDLLDLVRLDGGKLELNRERVDLREVADDAASTVRPLADAWGQRIRLCQSPDRLPVMGDRRRLEQIVLNLLTNAVKYGASAGNIWVTVGHAADGQVWLTVRDEGQGIAESDQQRIFERFYRLPGELTDRAPGTGLGLPIAAALAELHGGTIRVESAPGLGSTFSLLLPRVG